MDSENTFIITAFSLITAIILGVIGGYVYEDYLVSELIKGGTDPIKAMCSIKASNSRDLNGVCTVAAGNK